MPVSPWQNNKCLWRNSLCAYSHDCWCSCFDDDTVGFIIGLVLHVKLRDIQVKKGTKNKKPINVKNAISTERRITLYNKNTHKSHSLMKYLYISSATIINVEIVSKRL